jgi:hypothetical protein
MALASNFAADTEYNTLMDLIDPLADVDDAEEAVVLGLLAALSQALVDAQGTANATNRIGEAVGPHTANVLMNLTTQAHLVTREFDQVTGITIAIMRDVEGTNHTWTDLGPVH